MKFANLQLEELGIIVQSVSGMLDMPKRKGNVVYDWGHGIEPLVSAADIHFAPREIKAKVYFDERKGNFRQAMETLESFTTAQLLETSYGNYQALLHEVKIGNIYKGGRTLEMVFLEPSPDLTGGPSSTVGTGPSIDGHNLRSQFGLHIENTKLFEVEKIKPSRETSMRGNRLSSHRGMNQLSVKLHGVYSSKAQMVSKLNGLNKLLAKEGLRELAYGDNLFECFSTQGHKVNIRNNHAQLTLVLEVTDGI